MASLVILLFGPVGAGKTTVLASLVHKWRASGRKVAGILAHRMLEDGELAGYDLEIIGKEEQLPLARMGWTERERVGHFGFCETALAQGRQALRESAAAEVIVVDEIGPLELKGKGWAKEVAELLQESNAVLILVVRQALHDHVRQWLRPFQRPIHSFSLEELAESELDALLSG